MVAIARKLFRPADPTAAFSGSENGKIDMSGQLVFGTHRSGWKYALEAFESLHTADGTLFDGYVEDKFGFQVAEAAERGIIPYTRPWIGIAHHPPAMPEFFEYRTAPQNVFNNYYMRESLPFCKGIFTLSEYHRDWLQERLDVPVHALIHPTESVDVVFEIEKFLANSDRQILSIGYWLRRMSSIRHLPVSSYTKTWICAESYSREVQQIERVATDLFNEHGLEIVGKYREIPWVDNDAYDDLLSRNIVFLDFYDCSASNTIVECIVRNTPILVNRHPAIVEYLGPAYPFYFDSLEEAAQKAESFDKIEETYDYLLRLDKSVYTQASFRGSFTNSAIYTSLPSSFEEAVPPATVRAPFDTLQDLRIVAGEPLGTRFVLAVCYRNLTWKILRCLESILGQRGIHDFGIALVDDCSERSLDTAHLRAVLDAGARPYVLVSNDERKYLARNLYNVTNLLATRSDAIIVQVDGDDFLCNPDAMTILERAYDDDTLMTFGSFDIIGASSTPYESVDLKNELEPSLGEVWDLDLCRTWMHLKTYRKDLFSKVPRHYFLEKNGENWLRTGEDLSVQPKLAQLAGGRISHIKDVLYSYDLSGQDHELFNKERARYIIDNLYRLPRGSYIGECMQSIRMARQIDSLDADKGLEF